MPLLTACDECGATLTGRATRYCGEECRRKAVNATRSQRTGGSQGAEVPEYDGPASEAGMAYAWETARRIRGEK